MSPLLIESSSKLQVTRTTIKSRRSSNSGHLGPWFGVTCPWVPKNALVRRIAFFSFNWIFMRLADNLDRHKISKEFEFRPDRTSDCRVICPLVPKPPISDLVRSIACLISIETLRNLQMIWTGTKSRTSSKSRQIRQSTGFGVTCLLVPKTPIFDLVRSIAC